MSDQCDKLFASRPKCLYSLLAGLAGLLLVVACDAPLALSISEAKRRAFKEIGSLKDTSQVGLKQVMQDSTHHWLVAYNKVQTIPHVFLFLAENSKEPSHSIDLSYKQEAIVEAIHFEDVTHNGSLEMLVYLHYDYDLSYQGKELIIYQEPFDTLGIEEIFSFDLEQSWEYIDSFDQTYGLPKHRKRVENHATVEFFEGNIMIQGTINGREHHLVEYAWDDFLGEFKLVLDEELHEESEEATKGGLVSKVKGAKMLIEVTAHEPNCRAFIVEDIQGHVIALPKKMHDALRCSPVTSLSENGRFLVFMDHEDNSIKLYDFNEQQVRVLLDGLHALEGVSDVIWFVKGGLTRLAFIAVDLDEYEAQSKIHIWSHHKKTEKWKGQDYNREVVFECNFDGICIPQQQYDFRFSKAGNFLYRNRKTGNTLDDFSVLKLN